MGEPILIWGAGAIGGTMGAVWHKAGVEVLMVDIVAEHVRACREDGLKIEGPVVEFKTTVPTVTPDELSGTYKRIVLAVKSQFTREACEAIKPFLAEDGFVLSAQNGLNEAIISEVLGAERTMGCFVNFSADWHGPGQILYGSRGSLVIGELDGTTRPRTLEMLELNKIFEPDAIISDNIWGQLWGKMSYMGMLTATALANDSMSTNFADPVRFPVWRKIGAEVTTVARARGITPVGFGEYDPTAFYAELDDSRAHAVIDWLAAWTATSAKTHSGLWRDMAVRKRKTEIQNLESVTVLAAELGIEVPLVAAIVKQVKEVEDGKRELGYASFQELLDLC